MDIPVPATVTLQRKSNGAMLAYLQTWYPMLTGVILNLDGSITVTSSDTLPVGATDDILDALLSKASWETDPA